MIEMNIHLQNIIKELSKEFDEDSNNTYISVYINTHEAKHFLKRRTHACESLLKGDEKHNFQQTMDTITNHLKQSQEHTVAVFASTRHHFFKSVPIPADISNMLIVDSSPYIRPLARIVDEWESFDLVLINSNQAKIYTVDLGVAEQKKRLSSDIMKKHKKGGWSQARFQRLRKGAIHEFYTEVIDYMEKSLHHQLIIAGPGTPKLQFKEQLPQSLHQRVIKVLDIDMNHEQELIKQSLSIISDKEDIKSHQAVSLIKEEILKDGLAVYGMDETLEAARNGQIDVLVVEKDHKVKGCLCEHCQIINAGPIKDCPVCGGPTTEADIIEEIIEFSERTDARIEFTDDEEIAQLGHIAGLLRYKTE